MFSASRQCGTFPRMRANDWREGLSSAVTRWVVFHPDRLGGHRHVWFDRFLVGSRPYRASHLDWIRDASKICQEGIFQTPPDDQEPKNLQNPVHSDCRASCNGGSRWRNRNGLPLVQRIVLSMHNGPIWPDTITRHSYERQAEDIPRFD
jgi:hypothetical protein